MASSSNIPNDQGGDWRLTKYVEYQHFVPPVHYEIFKRYAKVNNLNLDDQIYLSWIMANTYQEVTSLLLLEEVSLGEGFSDRFNDYWKTNQHRIILGSSKKHMRYCERIEGTFKWFEDTFTHSPTDKLLDITSSVPAGTERTEVLNKFIRQCPEMGRFACDYFIETLKLLQDDGMNDVGLGQAEEIDWDDGSNLTSAIFNILYMDEEADLFDSGKMSKEDLLEYRPLLKETLYNIGQTIEDTYGAPVETTYYTTKLCSFRNLWKNSRYGGFHHDRQLGFLREYQKSYQEKNQLWEHIFETRKLKFKDNLLGELNGWAGIRKERKKLWTTKGLTGVEPEEDLFANFWE
jgi:hypothetical protein